MTLGTRVPGSRPTARGDDDDENLTGNRVFWSGVIILFLRQSDGSASGRGVRSTHAFTTSQTNRINELPSRCGRYSQALCRAPKTVGESPRKAATLDVRLTRMRRRTTGGQANVKNAKPGDVVDGIVERVGCEVFMACGFFEICVKER